MVMMMARSEGSGAVNLLLSLHDFYPYQAALASTTIVFVAWLQFIQFHGSLHHLSLWTENTQTPLASQLLFRH